MKKNLKNEILGKQSFSKIKIIVNSIVKNTIQMFTGGGYNKLNKLVFGARQTKIRLLGLVLMLCMTSLFIDCAVSTKTDEVAPTPQASACLNGQGTAGACTSCNAGYSVSNGTCIVQNNLVLSVNSLTIYGQIGFSTNFTITTDLNWTITAPAWLSVSPTSGGPGSAIQVNLTTLTLNTATGVTGTLSVKATAKPELNKNLNLTRSNYGFCGGTLGLSGPSIVVSKWVSMGAADHSAYNFNDPNGRFLVAVAKGCGGGNNQIENNLRIANKIFFSIYLQSAITTINSATFNFTESFTIGAFIDRGSIYSGGLSPSLIINNDTNLNVNLFYSPNVEGETGTLLDCNLKNQYLFANLANSSNYVNPKNTCITDTQFPSELKSTMNDLLRGASKPYNIL